VPRFRAILLLLLLAACTRGDQGASGTTRSGQRPWILLVTLDTTRADSIGPEASAVSTPSFNALAARGRRFLQAYATVPETLPSHVSMLTGLYPAGHGIHENGRAFPPGHGVVAEQLQKSGYRTAAFTSSFVLTKRFGLDRGFDVYDDALPAGAAERSSKDTTDRALAYLATAGAQPPFLWVHYFDPHTPYVPSREFRDRHPDRPYLGEIEAMDAELGRLAQAFEAAATRAGASPSIVVVGDHGEGLGDHGEIQHGHLLYQSTMHVPLVIIGPGVEPGTMAAPVSTRRIYHTILHWAGIGEADSLLGSAGGVVLGEAMKPYLNYGWQPQIMAVQGSRKAIFAGRLEAYDLAADPAEQKNLGSGTSLPVEMRKALDEYPVPSIGASPSTERLSEEARRNLASLGYVSGTAAPVVRKDAPRPADMTGLFPVIDEASTLFVQERYRDAIPLFQKILAKDPHNLDASLRLATSHSLLGQDAQALEAFKQAAALAPKSDDVRLYLALHYLRGEDWERAAPILEGIVARQPLRVAAMEGLATVREKQGHLIDAVNLRRQAYRLRQPSGAELVHVGELAMAAGDTPAAIDTFEKARSLQGARFEHDLELGVLYLAVGRLPEARDALDRVPPSDPEYPMALFKRAQVSVLLKEPDAAARIQRAKEHADRITRPLIAKEKLFSGVR
jgi:arylsulfatase A-like enzyme/Tfp pilus assembly protein PilF